MCKGFAAVAGVILATVPNVYGAQRTWDGLSFPMTSSWHNPQNWLGGLIPTSSDSTLISNCSGANTPEILVGNTAATQSITVLNSNENVLNINGALRLFGRTTTAGKEWLSVNQLTYFNFWGSGTVHLWTSGMGIIDVSPNSGLSIDTTVAGNGGLRKTGSGFLSLGGTNTYSGGTIIEAGTLKLGSVSALGTGTLTFDGSGVPTVYVFVNGTGTLPNAINMQQFGSLEVPSGTLTIGNVSGSYELQKEGAGTLRLGGTTTPRLGVTEGTLLVAQSSMPVGGISSYGGTATVTCDSTVTGIPSYRSAGSTNRLNINSWTAITEANLGGTVLLNTNGSGLTILNNVYNAYTSPSSTLDITGYAQAYEFFGNLAVKTGSGAGIINDTVGRTSRLSSLTLSTDAGTCTSYLNVTNNNILLSSPDAATRDSRLATVHSQIAQARNYGTMGAWGGWGITSSDITNADPSIKSYYTIALVSNANSDGSVFRTNWRNYPATANDMFIGFTYSGDLDLDYDIDGDDYVRIDQGYLAGSTKYYWGNIDYNGVVDGADYFLLDSTYLWLSGQNMMANDGALLDAAASSSSELMPFVLDPNMYRTAEEGYQASLAFRSRMGLLPASSIDIAAVPEPSSAGLLIMSGALLVRRRRR